MDISVSCSKCTKRKVCLAKRKMDDTTTMINNDPSEFFSISGSKARMIELRGVIYFKMAEICKHYKAIKEKCV